MFLRCQRSVTANVSEVSVLYMDWDDHGKMYSGKGMPPNCSSTRPPSSFNCTACTSGEYVYAVCGNVTENSKPVMEGGGRQIDLLDSVCPRMLDTIKNGDFPGDDAGERSHWMLIPIFLLFLFVLIVLFVVAGIKYKNKSRRRWSLVPDRSRETLENNALRCCSH